MLSVQNIQNFILITYTEKFIFINILIIIDLRQLMQNIIWPKNMYKCSFH